MKTKKTILIFITDIIPLLVVSFLGIFKFKLFLQILGSETLGLYQLFTQIMIYVALVDGGLSSAVLYSLYKPNTEGDKKKFNALLAGAYKRFSQIGIAGFGIAFIVSFFVPFLIKDGESGIIAQNEEEFYQGVKRLLADKELRMKVSKNAYKTIDEEWNYITAVDNLQKLFDSIMNNKELEVIDGPASKAEPV